MFTSAGLTPRFVIVSKGERKEKFPFEYRDDYVGYYDYLKMVGTSRAILDIAQQKQDGYSMRVMEAIFFNKKLVTTNTAVKQSVFYDENNIFILPNVTIGEKSIVGAGSVVTKSIPAYSVAVGNPAHVIKHFDFEANIWIED